MVEDQEFRWEQCIVGVEKGVYASGVGVENVTGLSIELVVRALCRPTDAERTEKSIGVPGRRAEDLREAPRTDAAIDLHLPESVLSMREPQAEHYVSGVFRIDVRHGVLIPNDANRGGQARQFDGPLRHRQGSPKPDVGPARRQTENRGEGEQRLYEKFHGFSLRESVKRAMGGIYVGHARP